MAIPDPMIASMQAFFPLLFWLKLESCRPACRIRFFIRWCACSVSREVLRMSSIGAITLVDVVAYPAELDTGTLFHELLVHVVQYRVLGLKQFARLYVRGFLERRRLRRNSTRAASLSTGSPFRSGTEGIIFRRGRGDPVALGWQVQASATGHEYRLSRLGKAFRASLPHVLDVSGHHFVALLAFFGVDEFSRLASSMGFCIFSRTSLRYGSTLA
jgi:hypothetical protein